MSGVINTLKSVGMSVANYLTPVLTESSFAQTGYITPDEFVLAGDFLVHHCPTWSWSSGDKNCAKSYLPSDKQFLMTKNVPCCRRASSFEKSTAIECVIENENGDGWVDTHHFTDLDSFDMPASELPDEKVSCDENLLKAEYEEDSEVLDMDEFSKNGEVLGFDDAVFDCYATVDEVNSVVQTRTYDLHITYDKYYRTPRLWFAGYKENGKPLSVAEMYEDISGEHVRKTVTIESHPHISGCSMASVHPCRHAEVMKKLINTAVTDGRQISVDFYLLIFLKFVQTVIPTVEYDYTRNCIL